VFLFAKYRHKKARFLKPGFFLLRVYYRKIIGLYTTKKKHDRTASSCLYQTARLSQASSQGG
jgi:hypothetical protein